MVGSEEGKGGEEGGERGGWSVGRGVNEGGRKTNGEETKLCVIAVLLLLLWSGPGLVWSGH